MYGPVTAFVVSPSVGFTLSLRTYTVLCTMCAGVPLLGVATDCVSPPYAGSYVEVVVFVTDEPPPSYVAVSSCVWCTSHTTTGLSLSNSDTRFPSHVIPFTAGVAATPLGGHVWV